MNISKEITAKIEELQVLEQNLQSFLMQKQAIQIDLNEATNALSEINSSSDDVYKIMGGIMIKSDKEKLLKELEEKKKILDLRVSSLEKQEKIIETRADSLRKEISEAVSQKNS